MPPVRFEPTVSASERPQTYALDRAATGTGNYNFAHFNIWSEDNRQEDVVIVTKRKSNALKAKPTFFLFSLFNKIKLAYETKVIAAGPYFVSIRHLNIADDLHEK